MPSTESAEAKSAYVLALSGSLRRHSIHTLLLQYLAEQSGGEVVLFPVEKLGALKPFNPDLEENSELRPQPELQELRTALLNSQGVIIASATSRALCIKRPRKGAREVTSSQSPVTRKVPYKQHFSYSLTPKP